MHLMTSSHLDGQCKTKPRFLYYPYFAAAAAVSCIRCVLISRVQNKVAKKKDNKYE